jgi:hypothetical protein
LLRGIAHKISHFHPAKAVANRKRIFRPAPAGSGPALAFGLELVFYGRPQAAGDFLLLDGTPLAWQDAKVSYGTA